jgi:NAD(P)-dependent dehydrogenase (short-subunit alcohol dehydrogenase family)
MLRESRGCIVNFAAVAGIRAAPQLGAYSAGKAAVVALTRALAIEEKNHGVRVNAIAPGMIDTEQNRRSVENPEQVTWISRDQITRVVLFLCSEAGSGVNGETVHVLGTSIS